jgi:hypothetical protein
MHPRATVDRARALSKQGLYDREVAQIVGVPLRTVRNWRTAKRRALGSDRRKRNCPRRDGVPLNEPAYPYLLGLYLGDGCLTRKTKDVYLLSIACCDAWPGLITAAKDATRQVMPLSAVFSGLIRSDGCRGMNRVRRVLADGDHWYEYPRYLFVNMSQDILGLCGQALDQLGVEWRFSKPTTISVAKKDAVARLDAFVGPKY